MVAALLVTSAATLLESTPFLLAAVMLAGAPLRWSEWAIPYVGCGCGSGPSARSLPAAAATCLVFGPLVAVGRLAAAVFMERIPRRAHCCAHRAGSLLGQLYSIVPLAAIGAVANLLAPLLFVSKTPPVAAFAAGAFAAFVISPCAVGAIGFAAALRGALPAACAGFLCVAGICDLRAWMRLGSKNEQHDALAYALTALACALVAARGGAGLVHPAIAMILWACGIACVVLTYRYRTRQNARLRMAPAIMLAGCVLAVPPPEYHATETSLANAFAGERIDFTGVATQTGPVTTLVRYAITCCRADAAPIVVRLERNAPTLHGWVHARGILVQDANELNLRTDSVRAIAPPPDPYVYR